VEITGKVLGVVGCGNIGSIVPTVRLLKMLVIAYTRSCRPERANDSPSRRSISTTFQARPFITRHTPLTDKTRILIMWRASPVRKRGVRKSTKCARGVLGPTNSAVNALNSKHGAGALDGVRRGSSHQERAVSVNPNVIGRRISGRHHRSAGERRAGRSAEQSRISC